MSDDPEMGLLFHLAWEAVFNARKYEAGGKVAPAHEEYALERAKAFLTAYKDRHPEVWLPYERKLREAPDA